MGFTFTTVGPERPYVIFTCDHPSQFGKHPFMSTQTQPWAMYDQTF